MLYTMPAKEGNLGQRDAAGGQLENMVLLSVVPLTAWVALALGAVLILAWIRHKYYDSWQGLTFLVGIPLFAIAFLAASWTLLASIPATNALREYTGRDDVWVKCAGLTGGLLGGGTLGFVRQDDFGEGPKIATVSSGVCNSIRSQYWLKGDKMTLDYLNGAHVLAHEGEHLRGVWDEAAAECYSLQRTGEILRILGWDEEDTLLAGKVYYETFYKSTPGQYQSSECRPGGTLDLGLAGGFWGDGQAQQQ
jgi:general stress protein CsbA